ncbi:hypothetical protein CU103_09940 [Phyllobacterium sophorae]|uniref:Uncharacterized protein n=1 Tax=Phyllobacterium sophorae TaxID=1520277 RepID=A0A2P7BFR2_9HYPH|nr:hypothetical protein CU103_09940 [Phyllobacterium sophorae]
MACDVRNRFFLFCGLGSNDLLIPQALVEELYDGARETICVFVSEGAAWRAASDSNLGSNTNAG